MKYLKIVFAFVVLLAFQNAIGQASSKPVYLFSYFKNNGQDGLHLAYSYDGYKWQALNNDSSFLKPLVGTDKLMRDPCIIKGADGKFHMVWTLSWKERGIGYASSTDLIHWGKQQDIPVMMHEPTAKNCWAPEIFYNEKAKEYMIYWATTIPGRFPESDSSGDNNHRIYYVTTKDFKTYSSTKLLYNQGFNVIDATIQKIGKQYVMFLKDETKNPVPQKNLHIAYSKKLTKGYGKPTPSITGKYWAEGPTVTKVGDKWVVYFDKYRDHKYGAISSTDLTNWTDISDQIIVPKGLRHGTIFTITAEEFADIQKALPVVAH
jgi:hypothetical protein